MINWGVEHPSLLQIRKERAAQNLLNAVPSLQHHHTVPPDHHHPNLVLRFLGINLDQLHISAKLRIWGICFSKKRRSYIGWNTCLVNSIESSSTRFMKGSKPQRVPSTWKFWSLNDLMMKSLRLSLHLQQNTHLASAIDPEVNPLVHKLLELRGVCLWHLSLLDSGLWKNNMF